MVHRDGIFAWLTGNHPAVQPQAQQPPWPARLPPLPLLTFHFQTSESFVSFHFFCEISQKTEIFLFISFIN